MDCGIQPPGAEATVVGDDDYRASTLVEAVAHWARATPEATVYTFLADELEVTDSLNCAQLERAACRIASVLTRLAAPGERVLLMWPDGLGYIVGFFGCLYAGTVAVSGVPPVFPRAAARFVAIVRDCRPAVVLGSSEIIRELQELTKEELGGDAPPHWVAGDELIAGPDAGWEAPSMPDREAIALIQYTSGSTREPRGVVLSHRNLVHNINLQANAFEYRRQSDVGVSWLPLSHDMGLIGAALIAAYGGGRCVLMSPLQFIERPVRWLRAITRYRATTSGGPNFAYDLCARRISEAEKADIDLRSWKIAFNGAETIRSSTLRRFTEAFRAQGFDPAALYPCYGLAEATLFVAGGRKLGGARTVVVDRTALGQGKVVEIEPAADTSRELVASGVNMQGQSLAIVNPASRLPCAPLEIGEIWVAGPSVARGYWGREGENREVFGAELGAGSEPYLRTGDLGFLIRDELYVINRLKDLIIVRGTNYYPQDIEASAEASHPAIRSGGSVAFAHDDDGEESFVVVCEIAHGKQGLAQEIIASIRRAIATELEILPRSIVLLRPASVPKTPSGKVQRQACREAYLEGRLPVIQEAKLERSERASEQAQKSAEPKSEGLRTLQDVERWFCAHFASVGVSIDKLSPDIHLTDFAVDSVMIVQLRTEIERVFGVRLQAADLFSLPSWSKLVDQIWQRHLELKQGSQRNGSLLEGGDGGSGHTVLKTVREGNDRLRRQRDLRTRRETSTGPLRATGDD